MPTPRSVTPEAAEGRLLARPQRKGGEGAAGLHRLGLGRDDLLYVPDSYRPAQPSPLVIMLHGAGGEARQGISLFRQEADAAGLLLLAPKSLRPSWDVIHGGFGPDVSHLDRLLDHVFSHWPVDASHLAIGGFSDGASYALSVGLTNGDLFTHVIAFSPGFLAPARRQGRPWIYISHGLHDQVLPINSCSRRLVPSLRGAGYEVRYTELDGPHTVPPEIAREGREWLLAAS